MENKNPDALRELLPKGVCWHRLGTILGVQCRRVTDEESWLPRYDGELFLSDSAGELQVRLSLWGIVGEFSFCVGQEISGLQLLDTKEWGYQTDARYLIRDFEENNITLYCRDIQVEVLEGEAHYIG